MKHHWTEDDAVFQVQKLVFAKYGEPDFRSKAFHCYANLPLAWRMAVMTNTFEGEIANGGLAQFLWNTFHHYARVLKDAADGYALVGAPDYAAAVGRCAVLCSRFEASCRGAVEAATHEQDVSRFVQWYDEVESQMSFPEEDLFGSGSDIVQVKGKWILAHMNEFNGLVKQ